MSIIYFYNYKIEITCHVAKDGNAIYNRYIYYPDSDELFRAGYWQETTEEKCIKRAKREVSDYVKSVGQLHYLYGEKFFFLDTMYNDMQQQFVCKGHPFFTVERYNKNNSNTTYLKSWREITEEEYTYFLFSDL